MNLFIVIQQPDGDWDHLATVDSVWDDPEKAEIRRAKLQEGSPDWPAEVHIRSLNVVKEE